MSSSICGVSKALIHPLRAAHLFSCSIFVFENLSLTSQKSHLGPHLSFCNKGWETSVVTHQRPCSPWSIATSNSGVYAACGSSSEHLGAVPSSNSVSHWEKADLFSLYSTHFSVPAALSRNTSCQRKIKMKCKIIKIPELFNGRPMSFFLIQPVYLQIGSSASLVFAELANSVFYSRCLEHV